MICLWKASGPFIENTKTSIMASVGELGNCRQYHVIGISQLVVV